MTAAWRQARDFGFAALPYDRAREKGQPSFLVVVPLLFALLAYLARQRVSSLPLPRPRIILLIFVSALALLNFLLLLRLILPLPFVLWVFRVPLSFFTDCGGSVRKKGGLDRPLIVDGMGALVGYPAKAVRGGLPSEFGEILAPEARAVGRAVAGDLSPVGGESGHPCYGAPPGCFPGCAFGWVPRYTPGCLPSCTPGAPPQARPQVSSQVLPQVPFQLRPQVPPWVHPRVPPRVHPRAPPRWHPNVAVQCASPGAPSGASPVAPSGASPWRGRGVGGGGKVAMARELAAAGGRGAASLFCCFPDR